MANSDKNILITPNTGSTNLPKIEFTGADNNTITLNVLDDGALSFEGSSGQLFSVTDSLTGTIFSVNDISGIPSIEVVDNGTIRLAEFAGNVGIGVVQPNEKLTVNGSISSNNDLYIDGTFLSGGNDLSTIIGGAANDATITIAAGNALAGGGDFTTNQSSNETITFAVASNSIGADELNVSGNGTAGQSLLSDGDGTFSWGSGGLTASDLNTLDPIEVGDGNTASGIRSSAIGYNNNAPTINASAVGYGNNACNTPSSAFGYNNDATGLCSSAFGNSNCANGSYSSAIGCGNIATASYSSAIGYRNSACGCYSSAIGHSNIACGCFSSAIGYNNDAFEIKSTAVGYQNNAFGYRSSAFGYSNNACGCYSSAIGYDNDTFEKFSSAIGNCNDASGNFSSAVGRSNNASGLYSSAVGYSNSTSGSGSSAFGHNVEVATNDVQEFGKWDFSTGREGAIRIHDTGMAAITIENNATAYTASASANGAEANGSLADGMFAFRRDGTEVYMDVNAGGTIETKAIDQHPSISAASSMDNSGVVVVQDVTLDGNGHVTGLGSQDLNALTTVVYGNNNTASGVLPSSAIGYDNDASGTLSSAFGLINTATGVYSSAVGYDNTTSGLGSSAFGYNNTATSINSVSVGRSNRTISSAYTSVNFGVLNNTTGGTINTSDGTISGTIADNTNQGKLSTAVGINNKTDGDFSSAVGYVNTASGSTSSAIGRDNTASGSSSSAVGYSNDASGFRSSAVGANNDASGNYSSAIGYNNNATTGSNSSAIGYENNASGFYSSAIGYRVNVATNDVQEFGKWSSSSREGAIRIHDTGMAAITIENNATAYTASTATEGAEANGELADGMFALRRNGDDIHIDINIGGTLKTALLTTVS